MADTEVRTDARQKRLVSCILIVLNCWVELLHEIGKYRAPALYLSFSSCIPHFIQAARSENNLVLSEHHHHDPAMKLQRFVLPRRSSHQTCGGPCGSDRFKVGTIRSAGLESFVNEFANMCRVYLIGLRWGLSSYRDVLELLVSYGTVAGHQMVLGN